MATLSDLSKLRGILSRAKNVVVLTGAGISAESGIPTFRGSGGFWRTYRSQDLATPGAFKRSPSLVWEFYHYRREVVFTKSPNQAHRALADAEGKLAAAGRKLTVITQNIDGLHQAAGSKNVVELHGSLFKTQCTKCRHVEVNRDSPICEALQGRGTSMEALLLVTDPGSPKQPQEPLLPTTDTENSNQQQPLMSVSSAEPQKTESPVGGPPPSPGQPSTPGSTGGGAPTGDDEGNKSLTNRQKLKLFMRDYGSTVIVFHITHSLALLGLIYVAFSAGLDMAWVVKNLGLEGKSLDVAAGASTFVIAYAVNKVLAPLRFAITFAVTPFIVRYLRRVGVLKTPK